MYLDPGFGSMLIQVLIASLAGLVAGFGIFRTRIIAFFRKKKRESQNNSVENNDDNGETSDE
jgi:hypothetical protein